MVTNFRRWLCNVGFHDAYMTRALLGYDLKSRTCGLVRTPMDGPSLIRGDRMEARCCETV